MKTVPTTHKIPAQLEDYFIDSTDLTSTQKTASRNELLRLLDQLGPEVNAYPIWHPILSSFSYLNPPPRNAIIQLPSEQCTYHGLDHTRFFRNGFITCPYGHADEIAEAFPDYLGNVALSAEVLDIKLYNSSATPILVQYDWDTPLDQDDLIPELMALKLMLRQQFKRFREGDGAETWENMKPFFLGYSNSSKGPLFVSKKTERRMKKMWNDLIETEVLGPIIDLPLGGWPA